MIGQQRRIQSDCYGCRKEFQEGETLEVENLMIEYKNYYFPLKEQLQRLSLLKTVIAFLNTKGGTLYIGIDDKTRQVIGVQLDQDKFSLDLNPILSQISPSLGNMESIKVQFVPVLSGKAFKGKYIVKILVMQGDPSKVYHYIEAIDYKRQIKLNQEKQTEIIWGFNRNALGSNDTIKGTKLMEQVFNKATNPRQRIVSFHQGCNPDPKKVANKCKNIAFDNLPSDNLTIREKLIDYLVAQLQERYKLKNKENYEITLIPAAQDRNHVAFILQFDSIPNFKLADRYVSDDIFAISAFVSQEYKFIDQGIIENTHFYSIGKEIPKLKYGKGGNKLNYDLKIQEKHSYSEQPYLLTISNLRKNLNKQEKIMLCKILQKFLAKHCKKQEFSLKQLNVDIKLMFSAIFIEFKTKQLRQSINQMIKIQFIRDYEFKQFFDGHFKWGVPTGNIILHHYSQKLKSQFQKGVMEILNFQSSYLGKHFLKPMKGSMGKYLNIWVQDYKKLSATLSILNASIRKNSKLKQAATHDLQMYPELKSRN